MSTPGHREIDHTADLGFDLWAPSAGLLFAEGTVALGELCYDLPLVSPRETRPLAVRGDTLEESLVRWLQEVYFLVESELWLTAEAADVIVADNDVSGSLHGEPHVAARHTLHTEIKAITYHGLSIECREGIWRATVVVDV